MTDIKSNLPNQTQNISIKMSISLYTGNFHTHQSKLDCLGHIISLKPMVYLIIKTEYLTGNHRVSKLLLIPSFHSLMAIIDILGYEG